MFISDFACMAYEYMEDFPVTYCCFQKLWHSPTNSFYQIWQATDFFIFVFIFPNTECCYTLVSAMVRKDFFLLQLCCRIEVQDRSSICHNIFHCCCTMVAPSFFSHCRAANQRVKNNLIMKSRTLKWENGIYFSKG